jgi:hypothetical protein
MRAATMKAAAVRTATVKATAMRAATMRAPPTVVSRRLARRASKSEPHN